jgi:hypothetical protein
MPSSTSKATEVHAMFHSFNKATLALHTIARVPHIHCTAARKETSWRNLPSKKLKHSTFVNVPDQVDRCLRFTVYQVECTTFFLHSTFLTFASHPSLITNLCRVVEERNFPTRGDPFPFTRIEVQLVCKTYKPHREKKFHTWVELRIFKVSSRCNDPDPFQLQPRDVYQLMGAWGK